MPTIKFKILYILASSIYLLASLAPQTQAYDLTETVTTSATATVPSTSATTSDTVAPTGPILIRPEDGTVTNDNKTEFVWRRSTDPNGNTVTYTLYLNGVATYLGISNVGNSTGYGYTARIDGQEIKLRPTISLLDGEYDWYVTAADPAGNTARSTTWHFTVDTVAPYTQVTDIDIYHDLPLDSDHPENFVDNNFQIDGPKSVDFVIHSEPWSTITLQFMDSNNQLIAQSSWPTGSSGMAYPYQYLDVGIYHLIVSSLDHAGNTTALPDIILTISQTQVSVTLPTLPGVEPGTTITFPYTPIALSSLPATIANIQTRLSLSYIIVGLLAAILLLLLIILWRRRYNLVLLTPKGDPITEATIYHSIPTGQTHYSPIYVSKREPISYTMVKGDHGRLYVRHLGRYSTFTVRIDGITYIFSLSVKRDHYTIVLG